MLIKWWEISLVLPVGAKIKFAEDKQSFEVKASNERFAVLTKPFNLEKTVFYTIVDLKEGVRWTENNLFWMWAETQKQCEEMLERINSNKTEISRRNVVSLNMDKIIFNS